MACWSDPSVVLLVLFLSAITAQTQSNTGNANGRNENIPFTVNDIPQPFAPAVPGWERAPSPPPGNNIQSFVTCVNGFATAGIVATVTNCIPQDTCLFTVTRSEASAQKACTLENDTWVNLVQVQFPRIILDCPGPVQTKRFRPSYTLCPRVENECPLCGELDLDRTELGADIGPNGLRITFRLDQNDQQVGDGNMEMADAYLDPMTFTPLDLNEILSLGIDGKDNHGTKNCNSCHNAPDPQPAPAGQPQLSPPINPFGVFQGEDLAPLVIYTNIPVDDGYPGVPANKNNVQDFMNVCAAISNMNNQDALIAAYMGSTEFLVTSQTLGRANMLCTALLGKVKRTYEPTSVSAKP